MSREQTFNDAEDFGEIVSEDLIIRNERDAAALLVGQLPYNYFFLGEQLKLSKVESFLDEIDPETKLSRRTLAARLICEVGRPESEGDMTMMFIKDNGEKFTQIGFDKGGNALILIDMKYNFPRLSLVQKITGTDTLKFTSEMLLNIFDTFVKIQKYRDENLAKN